MKKLSEMTEGERIQLCARAWDHPYTCTCDTCQKAWTLIGPDGFEKGNWGPFTEAEMRTFAEEQGVPFIEGEVLVEDGDA